MAGPVGNFIGGTDASLDRFQESVESHTRTALSRWLSERGMTVADALAGRVVLPAVLLHVLRADEAEWTGSKEERAYRSPRLLLRLWRILAGMWDSRASRQLRYLDELTNELERTLST